MTTAFIHPEGFEFAESDGASKKICACASDLDCVAEITGISYGDDVPQHIQDNLDINCLGRILEIKNNVTNEVNKLYNYAVEMYYQKPLIETNEATDKVMAEHAEKLKNDEGIKGIEKILSELNASFPKPIPKPPTVIKNISNPLVVGNEINENDIKALRKNVTKVIDTIEDVIRNYLRDDFKNVSESNVRLYVRREANKIKIVYEDIKEKLVENSMITCDLLLTNIISTINSNSERNITDEEKYLLKTNLIEFNNVLVGVYDAYISEYDAGLLQIMNQTINDANNIRGCN